jgi:hypothetical protein
MKKKKKYINPHIDIKMETIGDIPADKFMPIVGKPKKRIYKMKKVSIILDENGLRIEKYKKGLGVMGFMTGKSNKHDWKFTKEK